MCDSALLVHREGRFTVGRAGANLFRLRRIDGRWHIVERTTRALNGKPEARQLRATHPHMGSLEYNAAKEALRALTRTAAREWAPVGVTVNALCPATKSQAFFRALGDYPELEAMADAANPMGRMGDPTDDIAPVAVFPANEASRYLTGNTLFADGGSHINGVAWAPDLDT